jgi:hypothetical protein
MMLQTFVAVALTAATQPHLIECLFLIVRSA